MTSLQINDLMQQALKAYASNRMDHAHKLCGQVLGRDPNHPDAVFMLGQIAFGRNRLDEAASHMIRCLDLQPGNPAVRLGLGEIRTFQGQYDEAVTEYDRVLRSEPDNASAIAGKADAYEKSGRRDEACAVLRPFVEQGREDLLQAIVQARLDLHDRNYDGVVDLIQRHLQSGQATRYVLSQLEHLLGRALEGAQRYDEAFAAYERGNTTIPEHFDTESWGRSIDGIIESFSPQRFAAVPRASHGDQHPIFVVGMPRSGSTLVETILAAHSLAATVGELPTMQYLINSITLDIGSTLPYPVCIEDLDQNDVDTIAGCYLQRLRATDDQAQRIVDKFLDNYKHIGMLAVLFPQARIIHCRRHPLDCCFSCFQTPLSGHPYTGDLGHLGAVYAAYERLMSHWRDVLEIPMLEVQYETLVTDQETITRQLLDFCGLDFDERCLRFY